jgi:hypothetical protein
VHFASISGFEVFPRVLLLRSRACVVVRCCCWRGVAGASGHCRILFVVVAGACVAGDSGNCRLLFIVVAGARVAGASGHCSLDFAVHRVSSLSH